MKRDMNSIRRAGFLVAALVTFPLLTAAQTAAPAQTPPAPQAPAPGTPEDDKIPLQPGTHRLAAYITVDGATLRMPYVLSLPSGYTAAAKPPVIVFLHGMGERGTDLDAIFLHGIPHELQRSDRPGLAASFPFIVISPQCPPRGQRWDDSVMPKYLDTLLDRILPQIPHDADRISCTGLSMGGQGTWRAVFLNPDRYAAAAPISASPWHLQEAGQKLKNVHTLAFCGTGDGDRVSGSHDMAEAIAKAGGEGLCIEMPGGHFIWGQVYEDPRFYDWLLTRRKSRPGAPARPLLSEKTSVKPGFQQRAIPIELLGQQFNLDCTVYLPRNYRPGAKYPALLYLADDLQVGMEKDGMVLYGPAAEIARGDSAPEFVILCPQLLPAIARWDHDAVIAALEKAMADAEQTLPIDSQSLYVAGTNLGARAATMLSRRSPNKYHGEVALMTHPRTAFSDLRGDWMKSQRLMILSTTAFDPGRVQQINAFLEGAAPGSSYSVLPEGGFLRPFATLKIYDWLLQPR